MNLVAPFGFYGAGNIGDESTLQGFARLLSRSQNGFRVWVASRNPSHTARVEPSFKYYKAIGRDPWKWCAQYRSEAYVFAGGTPIMDVLGTWPLSEVEPLVSAAYSQGKPIAFVGVGTERLQSESSRRTVGKDLAPKVAHWSVRCERDKERLTDCGVSPESVTVAADMAWLLDPVTTDFGKQHLKRLGLGENEPYVGVNVNSESFMLEQEPRLFEKLARCLDEAVVRYGVRVLFLCNEVREDDMFDKAASLKIRASMKHKEKTFLVPNEYLTPQQMQSLIGCCQATISTRYHFCLFSALQSVPFLALERSDKVADLCWDMRWPYRASLTGLNSASDILADLQNKNGELASQLEECVRFMKQRAWTNDAALEALASSANRQDRSRALPPERKFMNRRRYYLSEMAVSNKHGGGLTLQRILQDDLMQFDNFFHVCAFATDTYTIIDELKAKEVNLHDLHTMSYIRPGSMRYYWEHLVHQLKLQGFFELEFDKHIRKLAEHILNNFDVAGSLWLVVPQDVLAIRVLNYIFRKQPVDYVTWMMDDHVIKWNNGWSYPDWHKGQYYPHKFEDEMAFHLQNARKVFVISPVMAKLYRDRFGVDSEVLFGPANPLAAPIYQSPEPSGPVRLCYFGAIWDWQRDTLEQLVKHLPSLNATVDLFTYHDPPQSLLVDCVRVRPPVPAQEVMPLIREYDGVLITVGFEEQHRGQAELNILTKMSECLASGTVTVMLAPEYAAMVQWVRETGGALVINDLGDPVQLSRIKCLKDTSFRERVLTQARSAAAGCSVEAMRAVWRKYWDPEKKYVREALQPGPSNESLQGEEEPMKVLSPIRVDAMRRVRKGN